MDRIIQNLPTYIDYNWLTHQLIKYSSPRVKIHSLLKNGEIRRIKKGIYIPGLKYNQDFSRGVLSNLIYGPSYVSFEYALSWYGFIPERVYSITAACAKRKKEFTTPVGLFTYKKIPGHAYPEGIDIVPDADAQFLIASPEKAIADCLAQFKKIETMSMLEEYLYKDIRMEYQEIIKLNKKNMTNIAKVYNNKNVSLFSDYLNLRPHHE